MKVARLIRRCDDPVRVRRSAFDVDSPGGNGTVGNAVSTSPTGQGPVARHRVKRHILPGAMDATIRCGPGARAHESSDSHEPRLRARRHVPTG